jgi:hypothetical protein
MHKIQGQLINKSVYLYQNCIRIYQKFQNSTQFIQIFQKDLQSAIIIDFHLLKEYLSEDYRDTVGLTDLMTKIKSKINFDSVSHFTILNEFPPTN